MNELAPTNSQDIAVSEPSALVALMTAGIIGVEEVRVMPIGTRIMLDDRLRDIFWREANHMAKSPLCVKHLKDDPDSCFAVIRMALNWGLDWHQVAQSTYSPGAGKIGLEGKLAVGAMIGSRKVKAVKYEHGGEWDRVAGKFKMEQALYKDGNPRMNNGEPVMVAKATYTAEDELGLYVIATALMHDDTEVSTPPVYLNTCHPRNSTLWAANPRRQIMYVADRMLFQIACADILMGVHFEVGLDAPTEPIDITPPRAVDPKKEGIVGAGEVPPMTEQGVVPKPPTQIIPVGPAIDESEAPVEPKLPRRRAGAKKVRVQLKFRDETVYKTAFLRNLKELAEGCEDWPAFEQLRGDTDISVDTAYPESERAQLDHDIDAILDPIAEEFDEGEATSQADANSASEATKRDDANSASEAKPTDETSDKRVAMFEGDKSKNPNLDLTE